jgi:beta-lactamase superfamily II metal-dependent hydrolase
MRRGLALLLTLPLLAVRARAEAPAKTLDIYYIDTEGGQATLFVSPSGQTALVDSGNQGERDPRRIMQAVAAAGVKQIDYLLTTHYHSDHIGGFLELAKLIPILHYVDHGPTVQPEQNIPSQQAYAAAIATGPHIVAKPGDTLPITGIDWTIVSAAGKTLTTSKAGWRGAGKPNPACVDFVPKEITSDLENAQSVGSVITYGKFRTIDLGDLLWNYEGQLACPVNRIGTIDLLLTTHHGMNISGPRALVHALQPRVAVMNNGLRKGATIETFETLETSPGLEDLWQLHWSSNGLIEHNAAGRFIANIEDAATSSALVAAGHDVRSLGSLDHSPAGWIKVSAESDGTFTVTNSRNGFSKTYNARRSDR